MTTTNMTVNIRPAMTAIKHAEALAMVYRERFGEIPELPKDMVEYHREPRHQPHEKHKTVIVMHPSNDLMDMILLMRQAIYGDA